MRAIWIDEGQDPDHAKLKRLGVTRISRSARDERTTIESLAEDRRKGFTAAIHRVPEWDVDCEAAEWAQLLSDDVTRLGGNQNQLAVQANAETHNEAWLVEFWTRWRKLRPTRASSWSFEGMQGGRITSFRKQILGWKIRLVPECYLGDMTSLDPDKVVENLCGGVNVGWGFPRSIVSPFYDAACLPARWDGFAFTQTRLPS